MKDLLNNVKRRVKAILEAKPETRTSDNLLYLEVAKQIASEIGEDIDTVPMTTFIEQLSISPYPPFESVRRTRQKVQAEHPELKADDVVQLFRTDLEHVYEDFVRC